MKQHFVERNKASIITYSSIVEGFTLPKKPTLHTVLETEIISVRFRRAEIPVDEKGVITYIMK